MIAYKIRQFKIIHYAIVFLVCLLGSIFAKKFLHSQTPSKEELIEKIMHFPMQQIVDRCKRDHDYSDEDMQILEKELKRFFILSLLPNEGFCSGMFSSHVDNLWHAFILHTKEYFAFSNQFFGHYLHHSPTLQEEKNDPEFRKKSAEEYRQFIEHYESFFNEEIHPIWLLDACD